MNSGQEPDDLSGPLAEIRRIMERSVAQSSVGALMERPERLLSFGKMLRAKLALRVGKTAGVPPEILAGAGAAIEIIHSASLLHDDVIDGAYLRRNAPAFWVERGVSGAILLGDLLFFKALEVIGGVAQGRLTSPLIRSCGEICEAESEQELILRGKPVDWRQCVSTARRKTGPLFAFMGYVAGGEDPALRSALQESGYEIGAAYQLADDILDVRGSEASAGKTLGCDQARSKSTAATIFPQHNIDPAAFIDDLCASSSRRLAPWPLARQAWDLYLAQDIRPAMAQHLAPAAP